LLDVIELPNDPPIIVHPLLRPFSDPPLQTYGEFVTFFSHVCEVSAVIFRVNHVVVQLTAIGCPIHAREPRRSPVCLHRPHTTLSHMAYTRDCTYGNIMLDPSNMFPESFHPAAIDRSKDFRRKVKWYSRTRRPTRYLLIDFGLSRRYDPANGPPLDLPIRGGDKSAPEHEDRETLRNPFPTDVYHLGNLIREYYIQVICVPLSS
jgi:hypothetical protein